MCSVFFLIEVGHLRRNDTTHHSIGHFNNSDVDAKLSANSRNLKTDIPGTNDYEFPFGFDARTYAVNVLDRAQVVQK